MIDVEEADSRCGAAAAVEMTVVDDDFGNDVRPFFSFGLTEDVFGLTDDPNSTIRDDADDDSMTASSGIEDDDNDMRDGIENVRADSSPPTLRGSADGATTGEISPADFDALAGGGSTSLDDEETAIDDFDFGGCLFLLFLARDDDDDSTAEVGRGTKASSSKNCRALKINLEAED